jgi:hypothetical protein
MRTAVASAENVMLCKERCARLNETVGTSDPESRLEALPPSPLMV